MPQKLFSEIENIVHPFDSFGFFHDSMLYKNRKLTTQARILLKRITQQYLETINEIAKNPDALLALHIIYGDFPPSVVEKLQQIIDFAKKKLGTRAIIGASPEDIVKQAKPLLDRKKEIKLRSCGEQLDICVQIVSNKLQTSLMMEKFKSQNVATRLVGKVSFAAQRAMRRKIILSKPTYWDHFKAGRKNLRRK
ncbi:MAG: hypothetical protein Q7K42_00275 [Candidatus Diapherotrites archaeon]|nr:hypothetical protein [Candidatus Diapherotrites archaeon]